MEQSTASQINMNEANEDVSPPRIEKGKGKAKAVEPEEEVDDDEEDEESEEDEEDEGLDDDLDQDLEDLINDVDPSDIVPVTRQRSTRSKAIDYSSTEAMQRAGLDQANADKAASHVDQDDDEDEDADFKGDETMEDD